MAMLHSASISHTNNHAHAAQVFSTVSGASNHSFLYTSAKITGVILFVILCALIVLSAQASSKEANAVFEAADQSANVNQVLHTTSKAELTETGITSDSATSASLKSTADNSDSGASVQVDINGETVSVPTGSSYQKVVEDANGTTTVNVNTSTEGDANNRSRTTTRLDVSSTTKSSTDTSTKLKITGDGD